MLVALESYKGKTDTEYAKDSQAGLEKYTSMAEKESFRNVINVPHYDAQAVALFAGTIKTLGNLALDLTPLVGDAKAFAEAQTKLDYTLAVLGTLGPVGDGAKVLVKEAKALYEVGEAAKALEKITEAEKSVENAAWHLTKNENYARSILENGINQKFLSPDSRFGKAFYVAEQPSTSLAEMAHYGIDPSTGIRFEIQADKIRALDLTNPATAKQWGYTGGEQTEQMKRLAEQVKASGFNAIRFPSERELGGVNIAVLNDFNDILKPQMVMPAKK